MTQKQKITLIQALEDEITELEKEKLNYDSASEQRNLCETKSLLSNHELYSDCKLTNWVEYLNNIQMIRKLATTSLSPDLMLQTQAFLSVCGDLYPDGLHARIIVKCTSVIPNNNTVHLVITDPYRSITTNELHISPDIARSWIGKMLWLDVTIQSENYTVTRVRTLKNERFQNSNHNDKKN